VNPSTTMQRLLGMSLVLACFTLPSFAVSSPENQVKGETIVMIRHGEKPLAGLGQLNCKGLNRALALPSVLIGRYGKPDFIYAPNPSVQVSDRQSVPSYSYVRPLATIEPTAIRLGMPVNTQIGFTQIDDLQKELLQPAYSHSMIFVAWEHIFAYRFAKQMLQSYGVTPMQVPEWTNDDYETIYLFHISRDKDGKPQATLEIQKENLGSMLKDTCPAP